MLNIGDIKLPINSITKTFAILAKRGAGKTYTAAVLAEEFARAGLPFVIFDPIDVWWGLRLSINGKGPGLPVVIFGGEHSDIVLDRTAGRKIAEAIIRENISCIISTFGMPKTAQRQFIADFAEEMLTKNTIPRHIFIEEAHEFVPQRVFGDMGRAFNAVNQLVVMGRNRGLGVTLVNQRAATVNKDVLTQLDTLIVLRTLGPQDRKALQEWVEAHGAKGDFNKFINSLASLPTGKAWIWSPEFLGIFQLVKIRKRETFHPDRESFSYKSPEFITAKMDVSSFVTKFKTILETVESIKGTSRGKKEVSIPSPIIQPQVDITALKNEYESKIIEKDAEITRLRSVILAAHGKLNEVVSNQPSTQISSTIGNSVELWINKLPKGCAEILRFLVERKGMKFTRSQLALACQFSSRSGTYLNYISILNRNKLIIKNGEEIQVNPELF